jgi:translation initiation factor 2 subunit 3
MVAKKEKKDIENSQPELNIGLVGHVDHGKTTLTEALSGKWTDTHSEEIKRGITIRLGYANCTIRKCPKCKDIDCFTSDKECKKDGSKTEAIRKISFVDAPGHESLMATMLSGATIMDGALLLVAANEECPQPQTREHLMALEISGIEKIIIVQNKIDLVTKEQAMKNYNQIKEFIKGTKFEDAPIIPISAQHQVNIDLLMKTMYDIFQVPKRDPSIEPLMFVARSFDVNKPGAKPDKIQGGILGGALKQGMLKIGDEIEILPGRKVTEQNKIVYKPLSTIITGLNTGGETVEEVGPGGSIGVLTSLDPSVVKSDNLSGSVVGHKGKLPPMRESLVLETNLLERVVGSKEDLEVEPIKMHEILMLNVNSSATVGVVNKLEKNKFSCTLKIPVCAEDGARVTISRRVGSRYRLIGFGIIQ